MTSIHLKVKPQLEAAEQKSIPSTAIWKHYFKYNPWKLLKSHEGPLTGLSLLFGDSSFCDSQFNSKQSLFLVCARVITIYKLFGWSWWTNGLRLVCIQLMFDNRHRNQLLDGKCNGRKLSCTSSRAFRWWFQSLSVKYSQGILEAELNFL